MTVKTLPTDLVITRGWRSDGRAYDPSATVLWFTYKGELFESTNRLGPGWPMVIRSAVQEGFWCATVTWENWAEAAEFIDAR